jgi:hypothetical protein
MIWLPGHSERVPEHQCTHTHTHTSTHTHTYTHTHTQKKIQEARHSERVPGDAGFHTLTSCVVAQALPPNTTVFFPGFWETSISFHPPIW